MRSSAPLPPHFSANSLGRCVWPQLCSKVVDGQVRGVVCDAAAQAHIQVQDLFFLPSEQIDPKDGLENCCDQLVDDCGGDARATSWWQRAPRIGLLPAPNSITNPECKSAPQSSKDSTFLDVNMWECCAGCQSHGEGVFSSAGFSWCWTLLHLSRAHHNNSRVRLACDQHV